MTYRTLTSLATGQPIPAAEWAVMRDDLDLIAAPPMCTLTRPTQWTVTEPRHVPFTTAAVDTHGFWTADAPTVATIPAGCDGTYLITAWCDLPADHTEVDGGPISLGQNVMIPQRITSGGTSSIGADTRSISEPCSFATVFPLLAGESVALRCNLSPVAAVGLSLQWITP